MPLSKWIVKMQFLFPIHLTNCGCGQKSFSTNYLLRKSLRGGNYTEKHLGVGITLRNIQTLSENAVCSKIH